MLIIIDTVRASMAGSEDSSEHVSAYLRVVRRIMGKLPRAAAVLAHHAGWQDGETQKKRERGSSAWRGNCDATLYLEAGKFDEASGETPLTLRTLKIRDAASLTPFHLVRRRVELNEMDRFGQPVTSCVIERDRRSREDREADALAAMQTEQRGVDLQVLRVFADRPDLATSQERIRTALNVRRDTVRASIARLAQAKLLDPPSRQRQPYTITLAGRIALQEGANS